MADNLVLWELQMIHETLTKTKEEHTLNFRMIKSTEKFNFFEPILNATKLGLIRLSVFNVNRGNNQFLCDTRTLAVIPCAYELTEIAELIKKETNGNVIIEPNKNTMKCLMEIKQGSLSCDVENSIASLLEFRKKVYEQGKNSSQKIIDIMGFSANNIHCNVTSGVKVDGNNTDILYNLL